MRTILKWCKNIISVFDYHVGHNHPRWKGGTLDISNLRPICSRCNLSMSNTYSIDEWNQTQNESNNQCSLFCSAFFNGLFT